MGIVSTNEAVILSANWEPRYHKIADPPVYCP